MESTEEKMENLYIGFLIRSIMRNWSRRQEHTIRISAEWNARLFNVLEKLMNCWNGMNYRTSMV